MMKFQGLGSTHNSAQPGAVGFRDSWGWLWPASRLPSFKSFGVASLGRWRSLGALEKPTSNSDPSGMLRLSSASRF